jgi:hypothetical protein
VLSLNAVLKHESLPLIRHILPAFVVPERLQQLASLLLSPRLELLEGREGFTLGFEEPAASEARSIIGERYPVLVAVSSWREWTVQVRVD